MLPYYILILLPAITALVRSGGIVRIGQGPQRDQRNRETVMFFAIFMGLLMLRNVTCGADTKSYAHLFTTMGERSWRNALLTTQFEYGYLFLTKLLYLVFRDEQWLIIATSLWAIVPLMQFYREEAEEQILTLMLFVAIAPFSVYFSGIRQVMAMAMAFPAWRLAKDKKWVGFILIVLLAMQLHRSAFVLLAIYPLYHLKITTKWLYVVIPVMLLIYVFNEPIFSFLLMLWGDYGTTQSTGATTVLFLLILFAVYSFLIADEEKLEKDVLALRNILLLTIVLQCFAPVHSLAMRMNYYFLPFVPILIPKIAGRSKAKFKTISHISVVVMTLFFAVYFFYRAYTSEDALHIYPYTFFWE